MDLVICSSICFRDSLGSLENMEYVNKVTTELNYKALCV